MANDIYYIAGILLALNLIAFAAMMVDKIKSAKTGKRRISEGMLFFMATLFGSVGVYAGMFAFRHKTRKWYFLIGIPLLMIENAALLYLLYLFLSGTVIW
ncbi:MAG: DUF1294 domain-containing protein [Candidatus Falkowbacteria bacterium]